MAGIGFRLNKLITGESYLDLIRGYMYSGIISTGPMLLVILSLAFLTGIIKGHLGFDEGQFFMGLIVYVYAFSMLGVSPFVYTVTRYLADKHFLKQYQTFTPTYFSCLEVIFLFQSVIAYYFLSFIPLVAEMKWLLVALYLFVNAIWIAMIFLSAAKNYGWIVAAFMAGGVVGLVVSLFVGGAYGFKGYFFGYTCGQFVTFAVLTARIMVEFGYTQAHDYGFILYLKRFPFMLGVGVCYYLGVWIDKLTFWFSRYGEGLGGNIFIFSNYDTPMFLAFLTVVPSMAYFLIQMETSFAKKYWAFYESIRAKKELSFIRDQKKIMIDDLTNSFQKFVTFQGAFSALVILFVYEIADVFYLNPLQMGIFRIGIVGAFLQMGMMMILNILFYFDFQKDAFMLTLVYVVSNFVFTWISIQLGLPAFGYGYTTSCFVSVLFGFLIMDRKLKNLEYWTFMKQPILIPKFKFESEGK